VAKEFFLCREVAVARRSRNPFTAAVNGARPRPRGNLIECP
jgi:hypothetical protein